jgi:hypothetical protein
MQAVAAAAIPFSAAQSFHPAGDRETRGSPLESLEFAAGVGASACRK